MCLFDDLDTAVEASRDAEKAGSRSEQGEAPVIKKPLFSDPPSILKKI